MRNLNPIIATILVIAAGCTSTSSNDDAATPPAQLSPIEEFTSAAFGTGLSFAEQLQQGEALERQRQEIIAQCMNEKGFEYIPHVAIFGGGADESYLRLDDRDWVEQWGYGIVDTPAGESRFFSVFADEMPTNPNQAIWESLGEVERAAYFEALQGPPPEPNQIINGVAVFIGAWPEDERGCQGRALLEVPPNLLAANEFAPLQEAIDNFNTEFNDNPAVVAAENDWANCMANLGHTGFTQQVDAQRRMHNQFLDRFITRASRNPALPAVIEFQEQEIAVALDDLTCLEQTDYRTRVAEARHAAELQFVEDHREALEAFRATAEQQ